MNHVTKWFCTDCEDTFRCRVADGRCPMCYGARVVSAKFAKEVLKSQMVREPVE
jgi:rubrerythrin